MQEDFIKFSFNEDISLEDTKILKLVFDFYFEYINNYEEVDCVKYLSESSVVDEELKDKVRNISELDYDIILNAQDYSKHIKCSILNFNETDSVAEVKVDMSFDGKFSDVHSVKVRLGLVHNQWLIKEISALED